MPFSTCRFPAARTVIQKLAFVCLLGAFAAQAAFGVGTFEPQRRLGYHIGDQWEPAMAADGHGHVYVLYPQYGMVPGCSSCTAPTIALLVSNDNGASWQPTFPSLPGSLTRKSL